MVTKDMIIKFYSDVEALGLKFPVAALSKATGFSKGNVSDYLNRKKEPSRNFIDSFYSVFGSSIKVPHGTLPDMAQTNVESSTVMLMEAITNLTISNRILAESNKLLAETISSERSVSSSSTSKVKGRLKNDGTAEIPLGNKGKHSEGRLKQTGSGVPVGK